MARWPVKLRLGWTRLSHFRWPGREPELDLIEASDRLIFERRRVPLRLSLLLAPLLLLMDFGPAIAPSLAMMTAAIVGSTGFTWCLLRFWPSIVQRFQLALRLLDVAVIFLVLLEVNGLHGAALVDVLYVLPVVAASTIGRRRGLLLTAAFAALAVVGGRIVLDVSGVLAFSQRERLITVFDALLFVYVGLVVHTSMRRAAEVAHRRERRLREEIAERNVALEQLTDQLARANAGLRESEGRFRRLAEHAPDLIYRYELQPVRGFSYISPASQAIVGYSPAALSAESDLLLRLCHPDDRPALESLLTGASLTQLLSVRWQRPDGQTVWCELRNVPVVGDGGDVVAIEGIARDITERKGFEVELIHNALHDALTRLPNRALFEDRLEHAMRRSARQPDASSRFAVLFLDLNRFKTVNDSLGHLAGDALLVGTARRLETCLREGDTVARFGGDEFAVLLEGLGETAEAEALKVAERIHAELTAPFDLDGREVYAGVSIGIALSRPEYHQPGEVLRDADIAMYRAKARGQARYELFDQEMHQQAVELLHLEIDLRHALERGEFALAYQPIVDLTAGRLVGFEALLRWQHEKRGLVSPAAFLPLAEETKLIVPIDRWVLREACRQLRVWDTAFVGAPSLSVSVNLSGNQFARPDLADQITAILTETGLEAHRLCVEVTESVLMENLDSARSMLAQLRALGVQVSIDDFGTGYSSLSQLHALPIDTLKIDRSFIARLDARGEHLGIVRAIIDLARHLNLAVVAEGIETAAQHRLLAALGCDRAQGYLFAAPLTSLEASGLLDRHAARAPFADHLSRSI